MNLTGKELVEKNIITGPIEENNIAQHGCDLNLIKVERIDNYAPGVVLIDKTLLPKYIEQPIVEIDFKGDVGKRKCWQLPPGQYNITFAQGCKIPKDQRMFIVQRSSVMRNGAILNSSIFDAGFETKNIGTFLSVLEPITIEVGARVAQAYCDVSNDVENLYNGQWQADKWRERK